jgi:hypothetical protein
MNTRTFLLTDGSNRLEVHGSPIHYRAPDGSWQPIDTSLAATSKAGFSRANEHNTLRSYLPGSTDGWVRAESDKGAVSFRPLGAASLATSAGANSAAWPGLWRNTSLSLAPMPGGLKETITLASADVPSTFRFALRTEGLTTRLEADYSVSLLDSGGNPSLQIARPWMQDASGKRSYAVAVALRDTAQGSVYTMTPDPAWLASASYPVTIDPTVTAYLRNPVRCGTGAEYEPANDRVMRDSCGSGGPIYPDNQPEVLIGPDPLHSGKQCEAVEVFGTNLASIGIPPNATIVNATFHFHVDCDGEMGEGGGDSITISHIPFATSAPMTWNAMESASSSSYPSITAAANSYNFNVTTIASYWVAHPADPPGLLLRARTAANSIYGSAQSSSALQITYTSTGTVGSKGPGIVAGIATEDFNPVPGEVVELHVTDGNDFLPNDNDIVYVDGVLQGLQADDLSLAKWSVSGGTLDVAQTADWLHGFRTHWTAPTTPGTYTVTLNVYDAGKFGASSVDSADPTPYTVTKTFDVGAVTYTSAPAIAAAIQVTSLTAPAGTAMFQLSATNGGGGAPSDLDSKFVGGVFAGYVNDSVPSIRWEVTDSEGRSMGTLSSATGTPVTWTVPASPPKACWIRLTADDLAANGVEFDDKPVIVTAPLGVGIPGPTVPNLTAAQVIAAAQAFCTAIGAPETGSAEAHYPAPVGYDGAQPTYYVPRWDVKYPSGTKLEIADADQKVVFYSYPGPSGLSDPSADPVDPADWATQAVTLASQVLTNAHVLSGSGFSPELGNPVAKTVQIRMPASTEGHRWIVTWPRIFTQSPYLPVPYRDQMATVVMQPESGHVQALCCKFTSVATALTTYTVTSAVAESTARGVLPPDIQQLPMAETNVQIILPNGKWDSGVSDADVSVPHVAWVCTFGAGHYVYEVWVDVCTGSVLGGTTSFGTIGD